MKPEDRQDDFILDETIREIRDESLDPAAIESAAGRVWNRLRAQAAIRSCGDFQALIPDYRAGRLSEARALLVKDHIHECVACRKALAQGERAQPRMMTPRRLKPLPLRWAIAAALFVTAGLTGWMVWNRFGPGTAHPAAVQEIDGALYAVAGEHSRPVAAGEELPRDAEVRTAKGSGAVLRLRDGSLVEMRERSSLSVTATRRDATIRLARGSVIVQAAKRRSGRLQLATQDCQVAVTGTVFSVSSGIKGSRVAVIEGEVRVSHGGGKQVLNPGEQFASRPALKPVPIADEIAWSRNLDQHLVLLREFAAIEKKLEEVRLPAVRYSSRLLDLLPAETALYVSIPNLGQTLGEAQQILRQRVDESPVLREWWQQKMEARNEENFDQVIDKIRTLSDYLGDEIVIAAVASQSGDIDDPIILAEVKRSGLKEFLEAEGAPLGKTDAILLRHDLVAMSPDAAFLRQLTGRLNARQPGGFAGTPFHSRIQEAYRDGAGLLFSVDLEKIHRQHRRQSTEWAGMKHLVVEHKATAGTADTRAILSFLGQRQGMASWLAAPAPIGALDFVSPDASLVSAFAIKQPSRVIEDLLAMQPNLQEELREMEGRIGMSVQYDLALPLGAEFAFAFDGAGLPNRTWKLALEVYDPGKLQSTIERLVEAANRERTGRGLPGIQLSRQPAGDRTYYTLSIPEAKLLTEVHYVFVGGYLLAAADRAMVDRAIQHRATGYALARSSGFTALLPQDRHANFSGMIYYNLGPALAPFVSGLSATNALTPDQRKTMETLSAEMKPALITLYGEEDRITLATTGSLLGLGLRNLVGVPSFASLARSAR